MTDFSRRMAQPTMADKTLAAGSPAVRKRKEVTADVVVHITTSFNNTIVCISRGGDTFAISSAGACDFKGTKKGTGFAASVALQTAIEKACAKYERKYNHKLGRIEINIKGSGQGSEQAIMALKNNKHNIEVTKIIYIIRIPHNGCRPPKRRRV